MEFIILLLLLVLNGVFALYEIALVSSNKVRIANKAEQGSRRAATVLRQMENPEQTLSTIQIGITLIGIVSGAFGGMALAEDIEPLLAQIPQIGIYAAKLSVVITIAFITFLSLVIGELVPKSMALNKPEWYAMFFSGFISALTWFCYPIVWLLSVSTSFVNKLFGVEDSGEQAMTQEELKLILRQSSEQGVIDPHETEMLQDVFRFSDKRVNELMTPRHEMIVFRVDDTREEVVDLIQKNRFSKYLLIGEEWDDVLGVVSVKDLLRLFQTDEFDLRTVCKPALFLPESIYAKKAVELFKKNKTKFGVVVNEYGGIEGLVTLHDLTESVFGDILEENEIEEPEIIERQDGSLLVDGAMNLDDFMEAMNINEYEDIEDEGFTTIGGMAMFCIGRMPKTGDCFQYRDLEFEIMDMDGERVDKLLVTKVPAEEQKEENENK